MKYLRADFIERARSLEVSDLFARKMTPGDACIPNIKGSWNVADVINVLRAAICIIIVYVISTLCLSVAFYVYYQLYN